MGIYKASTETHISQVYHSMEQLRVFLPPVGATSRCHSIFLVLAFIHLGGEGQCSVAFLVSGKNFDWAKSSPLTLKSEAWWPSDDYPIVLHIIVLYFGEMQVLLLLLQTSSNWNNLQYSFLCPLSLTTELLFGVWILEYIQELLPLATPTWRPLPWLTTYGNPAMSHHAGGSWLGRVSSRHWSQW